MKNGRLSKNIDKNAGAKPTTFDIPPRLTGQDVLQVFWFWIDDLPESEWPRGFKPRRGVRKLFLTWPDTSSCCLTIPVSMARLELATLQMLDMPDLYSRARKALESDWKRGRL